MATKSDLSSLIGTADITAYMNKYAVAPKSDDKFFKTLNQKGSFWSTVTINGSSNTAAGIITGEATTPVFSRPEVKSVIGQMLTIGGGYNMSEKDIQEFYELKMKFDSSKNAGDAQALLDFYGNDIQKCRSLIQNEKNYLNWSLLSNACNITNTLANSSYSTSMAVTSYPVEGWQKDESGTDWSNTASLIVTDILAVVEAGRAKQKRYTKMFVNSKTFGYIRKNLEVQNNCASRISVVLASTGMPSEATINQMLNELCGIQIVVISDLVDRESAAGIITTSEVFANDVAVFAESDMIGHWSYNDLVLGNLEVREGYYKIGNILKADPNYSKTYAKAEGFSVIDSYASNFYFKTNAVAW